MKEFVHCYSDFRYPEQPRSFQWENNEYTIKKIVAEWKTEDGFYFVVMTETNLVFNLHYKEFDHSWKIKPNTP